MAVKPIIDPAKFQEDVKTDLTNLTKSFADQAELFAYYATLKRQAIEQTGQKELARDVTRSNLDKQIRELAAADGRKTTEAAIEQEILRDPKYVAAQIEVIQSKGIENLCKDALAALEQRRDMLIQIGADAREDMKGQLRMIGTTGSSHVEAYKAQHGLA